MLVHLPLDGGQLPFENHDGRYLHPLLHIRRGKAGKALAVGFQLGCPVQIDVQGIVFQVSGFVAGFAQQCQGGVAVKVKNRYVH